MVAAKVAKLFSPFNIRSLGFKIRIFVSPMCQYSALEGMPSEWHLVHLGSRGVGGAALVMCEATAVSPIGRISAGDLGIYNDEQVTAFQKINQFILQQGAVPAIQLAHAGRKASTDLPWKGGRPIGPDQQNGWQTVAPSALPFGEGYQTPTELTEPQIKNLIEQFRTATERSLRAGFKVVELHMAHGYLLHEFLSPLSNHRHDQYGGSLENRMRLPIEICAAVRKVWPNDLPLFVRISASDWVDGGWSVAESIEFVKAVKKIGVDLIDVSSGGAIPNVKMNIGPGYQVSFAAKIRQATQVLTGAVGMITESHQAEQILEEGSADVIFLARELLRDPYWPLRAARELKVNVAWPPQYERAKL